MKQGLIHTGAACVLALALQGCATSESETTAANDAATPAPTTDCHTVFHCPADPEDIHICLRQDQLQVQWRTPGIDAYQLTGTLGQTFSVSYSQNAQVIENTLAWQHMGVRYRAFHYLDESRPETLEEIGVTLETRGETRTISCNDNAVSQMARLHPSARDEAPGATGATE